MLKVLSLFGGCGGLDQGFINEGNGGIKNLKYLTNS